MAEFSRGSPGRFSLTVPTRRVRSAIGQYRRSGPRQRSRQPRAALRRAEPRPAGVPTERDVRDCQGTGMPARSVEDGDELPHLEGLSAGAAPSSSPSSPRRSAGSSGCGRGRGRHRRQCKSFLGMAIIVAAASLPGVLPRHHRSGSSPPSASHQREPRAVLGVSTLSPRGGLTPASFGHSREFRPCSNS